MITRAVKNIIGGKCSSRENVPGSWVLRHVCLAMPLCLVSSHDTPHPQHWSSAQTVFDFLYFGSDLALKPRELPSIRFSSHMPEEKFPNDVMQGIKTGEKTRGDLVAPFPQTESLLSSTQPTTIRLTTLLLGDTDGAATATGGLGVLTADTEAPVVTETTVGADLLEALEIVAELGGDAVGENLGVLAVDDVALTVEEPAGDLVLAGVLDDGDDALKLLGGELTGALVQVDIGLLANNVGVATTDTRNLGEGVHDLVLTPNVGVQETENELEVRLLPRNERHAGQSWW